MIFLLKRIYLKLVQKQISQQRLTFKLPDGLIKDKILNYLFSTFCLLKQPRNKYQTALWLGQLLVVMVNNLTFEDYLVT
jgi:hypothetical protein